MEKILDAYIEQHFRSLAEDLQVFLKIRSVLEEEKVSAEFPFGPEIDEALRYVLNKGQNFGLKSKYLDGFAGYVEAGQGSEMVGVFCHVDVVPEGSGWTVDPYGGEIVEGKLYGRGSVDNKGPILAVLYALKAIRDTGLPTSKRVRLILGTDEETAGRCIKHYLAKEEPPVYGFSPDAEFPIIYAEKGILRFEMSKPFSRSEEHTNSLLMLQGGTKVNVVPDYAEAKICGLSPKYLLIKLRELGLTEKIKLDVDGDAVVIKATGISSHASYPGDGENAIQLLFHFLEHVEFGSPAQKQFLAHLNNQLKMETDGRTLGLSCNDEVSGALTLNLGVAEFTPEQGHLVFDIRYPVTLDGEEIIEKLKEIAQEWGADFSLKQHKLPLYVEPDREFIKTIQRVYQEVTGDTPRLISIGGGTYCRYVENTVSFGPVFPGQKELAHQKDEHLRLDDLKKLAKIYAQTIYELIT
ncbi:MAG: dipeptidase PepV [Desulfitobacterium hafniense]|nr:dipeptidase PepV [Desulfitobacterium hafniense]